jgi:hypothetical protein
MATRDGPLKKLVIRGVEAKKFAHMKTKKIRAKMKQTKLSLEFRAKFQHKQTAEENIASCVDPQVYLSLFCFIQKIKKPVQ